MNHKNRRKFWIVIDHPLQLVMAISISKCLRKRKANKPILLISRHEYWKFVKIEKYSKYFSDIFWFRRTDFPPFTMPIWKQFLASGVFFFELALMKLKVSNLKIKKNDVILGLTGPQILENMVLSVFNKNQKVAVLGGMDLSDKELSKSWKKENMSRHTMGGWLFKFIYSRFFKLISMDVVFKKEISRVTDADWIQTYTNDFKNIYDKILIVNNITDHLKELVIRNMKNTYFPYLIKNKREGVKKKVIFFGVPYVKEWGITKKQYTFRINQYLKFIRKYFGDKYGLEYRPHPREKVGEVKLNINGFGLAKDRTISELYFLDNGYMIKSVFSVSSVSSRSALNFGIDSHVYPNLFPLKPDLIKTYKEMYGNVPEEFYLKDLKSKPPEIKFQPKTNASPDKIFTKDLFWSINQY